jgi:hypothetical protein
MSVLELRWNWRSLPLTWRGYIGADAQAAKSRIMKEALCYRKDLKRVLQQRGGFDCVLVLHNGVAEQREGGVCAALRLRHARAAGASVLELHVRAGHARARDNVGALVTFCRRRML